MAGGIRRKSSLATNSSSSKRSRKTTTLDLGWKGGDDEIDSGDDDDESMQGDHRDSSSDSEEEETLEVKKVRLAREYLQKIERGADESSSSSSDDDNDDDDDDEVDRVGLKLQKQRLKREGVYESAVADKLAKRINAIHLDIVDKRTQQQQQQQNQKGTTATRKKTALKPQQLAKEWVDHGHISMMKGHDLTTTCVSLQADGSRAVSGSKDHSVMLWDVERSTKLVNLWEHWKKRGDNTRRTEGQVLSVACSDDGRYAAVGRRDATVSIFDIRSSAKSNLVKTFKGHKSAITCLAFQTQSLQLFSGSEDRCIRYV